MTSDRPYRLAMTPHDAIAELQRSSGAQFDPKVVAALQIALSQPTQELDHEHASKLAAGGAELT